MYKGKKVYAVVLAAGKGTRIGFDKMLYKLDKYEVAHHSVKAFSDNEFVDEIIMTAGDNYDEICTVAGRFEKVKTVVKGSYSQRMCFQMLWVIAAIVAPCFHYVAGILPLLFPGTGIKIMGILKK